METGRNLYRFFQLIPEVHESMILWMKKQIAKPTSHPATPVQGSEGSEESLGTTWPQK